MAIRSPSGRYRLAKNAWFFTAAERDRVLDDMSRKHEYSRIGDQPALVFEKVKLARAAVSDEPRGGFNALRATCSHALRATCSHALRATCSHALRATFLMRFAQPLTGRSDPTKGGVASTRDRRVSAQKVRPRNR